MNFRGRKKRFVEDSTEESESEEAMEAPPSGTLSDDDVQEILMRFLHLKSDPSSPEVGSRMSTNSRRRRRWFRPVWLPPEWMFSLPSQPGNVSFRFFEKFLATTTKKKIILADFCFICTCVKSDPSGSRAQLFYYMRSKIIPEKKELF